MGGVAGVCLKAAHISGCDMLILLVNQTFSLVRPFKRLCFLKYALKGTGNMFFMRSLFFFPPVSLCSEDNV